MKQLVLLALAVSLVAAPSVPVAAADASALPLAQEEEKGVAEGPEEPEDVDDDGDEEDPEGD